MRGEALMPTTPQKARKLLKENKAKIIDYQPFTIQLLLATGEARQEVSIGVDSGAKAVGIAITSKEKVLCKGTIELRTGVKELLTTRRSYRRGRRYRKTRYRKPRFLNRTRPEGWLPPSIQSRVDNQIFWVKKFASLVPEPKIIVEVGKFDVQKILNPDIEGKEYQQGKTYGFWNDRYYIFARDNYTCVICKGKSKDRVLQTHHIIQQKDGGTDRVDNLVTVCSTCHEKYHQGKNKHKFKKPKQYKETAFMNILRRQIFQRINCKITYGNITIVDRKELGLEKSHSNDAVAISGIKEIRQDTEGEFLLKQFRKKKRSLHEAIPRQGRKEPNRTAKRNNKNTKSSRGFFLNDKVRVFGRVGFISGFTNGGAYVKDIEGNYITIPNKSYKQVSFKYLEFVCHNNNWQFIPQLDIGRGLLARAC